MQAIAAITAKPESGSASVVQNGAKKSKTSSFASLLDSLKSSAIPDKKPKSPGVPSNEAGMAHGVEAVNKTAQSILHSSKEPKPGENKRKESKPSAEAVPALPASKANNVPVPAVHLLKSQGGADLAEKPVGRAEHPNAAEKNARRKQSGASSPGDAESAGAGLSGLLTVAQDKTDSSAKRFDPKESGEDMKLGTERNASGAKISVVDMRLKAAKESSKGSAEEKQESGGKQNPDAPMNAPGFDSRDTRAQFGGAPDAGAGRQAASESKPVSFADQLAGRIRESAGSDIVKAAHIVLRDGDSGMIRLRLDPESLGGVKIELKIADKKLSGIIVVESDMAGQAFKDSLESLRDAFNASGFETQSLEVEVRSGDSGGRESGRDGNGENTPYFSRRLKELDAAVPPAGASASADGLLNVVI